jgi:hypothetical protein
MKKSTTTTPTPEMSVPLGEVASEGKAAAKGPGANRHSGTLQGPAASPTPDFSPAEAAPEDEGTNGEKLEVEQLEGRQESGRDDVTQ